MRIKPSITTALLLFFLCAVKEVSGQDQPQPTLIEGLNLNVGTGNTLLGFGLGSYSGNAIGLQNLVQSPNALAVGSNDTIDTYSASAVTLGASNRILGTASMGFGVAVKVNGNFGVGIGHHIRANGVLGSMVVGSGIIGNGTGNDAYLVNAFSNSLAIGFNSTKPTLFVSESPNDYSLGVLDKTGKVAIGDVTPQAKLHIRSDNGEDAGIFLQPANPASDTYIRLRDNAHRIAVDGKGCMSVVAGNANALEVVSSNMKLSGSLMTLGGTDNGPLYLYSGGTPSVTMNALPSSDGYSRNAIAPSYAIEFGANGLTLRTATYMIPRYDFITNWRDALLVKTNGAITLNGRVGVNTENTTGDYALAVDGGIITTKVHIQDVNDWEDRVFDADYPLMTLDDVEEYVAEHRHLPGIPSEAEVMADGFDMAAMAAALLGKVEELTLYTIRQQREIDSLRDLVTVRFGYDACGNRTRRTLEFSMVEEERSASPGGTPHDAGAQWQASLSDSFAGMEAMLFPNPTEGGFFLALTGDEIPDGATATLCSVDGKAIEERKVGGMTEEFDLRGKPAGVYLLRLSSSDSVKTWKIVKR